MKKRIHVNQHVIKSNQKTGARAPVFSIKTSKGTSTAHRVDILGPCTLVYSPDKPLSCGARVWIETDATLIVIAD